MEERYWEKFMATGKIDDYLNYRIYRECGGITADRISGTPGADRCRPEGKADGAVNLRET